MQRRALCRSRAELSNEYLLSKFGFDTAENEPSHFVSSSSRDLNLNSEISNRLFATQVCCKITKLKPGRDLGREPRVAVVAAGGRRRLREAAGALRGKLRDVQEITRGEFVRQDDLPS